MPALGPLAHDTPPVPDGDRAPRRLLPSLSLLSLVIYAALAAVLTILLPNQIAMLGEENKVENLAAVTSVSFAFTIFAQPLAGALSDRTVGRFGKRVPWILLGAIIGGSFLIGFGGLGSLLWIGIFWVLIQFALNMIEAPVSAMVPDHYPRRRRGVVSAVVGAGTMTGGAAGTVFATRLTENIPAAYATLGALVILAAVAFACVTHSIDVTEGADARSPFSLRRFIAAFWVDPRRHPDFTRSFVARMVFLFGYTLVYTFQLFVLTDYIGLDRDDANTLMAKLAVVTFVTTLTAVAFAGWWSDRIGRRKVFIVAACALLVVALTVPLLMPTVGAMTAFAAIKGIGFGIFLSSGAALFTEVLPGDGEAAGKDLGILNVAINIPQALSPIAAAFVISVTGGYEWLFLVAIIAVTLAGGVFASLRTVR